MFATNYPLDTLEKFNLDCQTLTKKYPFLIYALVTPWGLKGRQDLREDTASWWISSTLAGLLTGPNAPTTSTVPIQFGEIVTSNYVTTGITTSLYHQLRTNHGQFVDVSLVHSGMYALASTYTLCSKNPVLINIYECDSNLVQQYWPIPSANSFRTKDGMWIQMLHINIFSGLPKVISSFGLYSLYAKIIQTLIFEVLPNKQPHRIMKMRPLFKMLNTAFAKEIGSIL